MQRKHFFESIFLSRKALVFSVFLRAFKKKSSPCWVCFTSCWIVTKSISVVNAFEGRERVKEKKKFIQSLLHYFIYSAAKRGDGENPLAVNQLLDCAVSGQNYLPFTLFPSSCLQHYHLPHPSLTLMIAPPRGYFQELQEPISLRLSSPLSCKHPSFCVGKLLSFGTCCNHFPPLHPYSYFFLHMLENSHSISQGRGLKLIQFGSHPLKNIYTIMNYDQIQAFGGG